MTAEGRRWVELDLGAAELSPPDRGRSSLSHVFQPNAEQLFPSLRSMCVFNTAALRSNCSCKHNPHKQTRAGLVDVLIHMQSMYEVEAERSHDSLTAGLRYVTAGKHAGGCVPESIIHLLNNLPKIRVGGAAPWTGPTQRLTLWTNHVSGLV